MAKTLDITRILREQKEQLRAGFQDRLVMTASICLRVKILNCILEKSDTTVFKTRAHTKNIVVSYATQPSLALSLFLALASQKTILNRFLLAPPL